MAGKQKYRTEHANEGIAHLEQLRERLGWAAHRMAQAVGVSFRTYQKWLYTGQHPRHFGAILARAEGLCAVPRANCWDVMRCGRGPNGAGAGGLPKCAAALETSADGVNGGVNGGRVCWAVAGTLCNGRARDRRASRLVSCLGCDFFSQVQREEGLAHFKLLQPGQVYRQG